jgi:hypothetical protein
MEYEYYQNEMRVKQAEQEEMKAEENHKEQM